MQKDRPRRAAQWEPEEPQAHTLLLCGASPAHLGVCTRISALRGLFRDDFGCFQGKG